MWKKIDRSGLKVGDFVNYAPTSNGSYVAKGEWTGGRKSYDYTYTYNSSLKWRIFAINDDGTVDLVPVTPNVSGLNYIGDDYNNFYLSGATGYNNGVYLLNEACKKLYSNNNLGIEARSINMNDMSRYITLTFTPNVETSGYLSWGDIDDATDGSGYARFPSIYKYEKGSGINSKTATTSGIDPSDPYYSSPTTDEYETVTSYLTITSNFGWRTNSAGDDYEITKRPWNEASLYGFWIATRAVTTSSLYEYYSFGIINFGTVSGPLYVWSSDEGFVSYTKYPRLCPLVRIPASINITACSGTNSSSNMHTIDGL